MENLNKIPVDIVFNPSPEDFIENIQKRRKPCVLQGVEIGECVEKWNSEYLSTHGAITVPQLSRLVIESD